MTTTTAIAIAVDELVHRTADDKFEIDATLYANFSDGLHLIAEGIDPYAVLELTSRPKEIDAVALVVTGWASPHNGDDSVRPSQHPERIRVRIVACMGIDGFSTVMRRADIPDEVEDMGGGGTGAMRDAMEAWWVK